MLVSFKHRHAVQAARSAVSRQSSISSSAYPVRSLGFTLIELIIVISIIAILTSIVIPVYRLHIIHAKEAVLREDLHTMRQSIDQYTEDKNKAPQSLDDLVSSGYMKLIPKDPFTDSNSTWDPTSDDSVRDPSQTEPGIVDVHSGSKSMSSDGSSTYDTW